ncbi:MAG: MOSC N-terminal beta barrel domain-containing protein, partial [Allosphingosinicella sp.]
MAETVGRVVELNRFPVKSMAADPVSAVEVDWQGIEGDRQYAFYLTDDPSRFPWL